MHLSADLLRGMTYGQRVLMEHLNTQCMILKCQLATASEPCGADCKKAPNIRSNLRVEALELTVRLADLERERDEAHALSRRCLDALKNLVAHLQKLRMEMESCGDNVRVGHLREVMQPEFRLLLELIHAANQLR